ncbi:microcin C transport system substrate-binding protein [Roseibium hamelinense]|uniref:Microcin C transport system substrate-binding protein n=1 Tax=Roseibium hamelinense TaxID=150831 RepID=A0A562T2B7_9HYPH|nr:extracellular solute-binding protein [Roseibium hamelinense]MTI44648.1 ABC transporter substrate-binding protein [Roseibium hamelinense]TWI87274.1 microcin C transport system substrate-binding protein [Roseibium hamelinense]
MPQQRARRFLNFSLVLISAVFAASAVSSVPVKAQEPAWRYAVSFTGEPKYGPDTDHFDYVNPLAPKGGSVRLATTGGFDSFNIMVPRGNLAPGIGLIYDTLMEASLDEADISAQYGVLAEAMRYPEDYAWVEYRLNPEARWHDGEPVTVEDVIWSFETVTEFDPRQRFYYQNVVIAEPAGERTVKFTFDAAGNRELPKIMGQLYVLPKHWWEGTAPDGTPRDISSTTSLETPLGSGPYRIKEFDANRQVTYERVKDYWGADLPIRVGTNNFDEVRIISFLDNAVEFEAFKGDQYDFRQERSASQWAKAYDFPATRDGRVVKEVFADKGSGRMQGYIFNLRRDKFQDPRVRQAFNYAYDFETTNEVVSAGLLKRIGSYFAGTDLAATGLPEGRELEILEEVRDLVPPEVFTEEYKNPVGGSPQNMRQNLRTALSLLKEAGYELDGRRLINKETGEQLTVEFIYYDKSFERSLLPFTRNLENIGVATTLRLVDQPQFINRVQNRDFDMTIGAWPQSLSPGNEQRDFWGSEAADRNQSRNSIGIKNPAVDKLIDRLVFAEDRETLVAATKALDRVLLWNHYVVPQFYSDVDWTARWNRFGHPENMPVYSIGFPTIWWYDAELAQREGLAR